MIGANGAKRGGAGTAVIAVFWAICNHNYMSTEQEDTAGSSAEQAHGWFLGRLPDGWFEGQPEILLDREEITVIGNLPPVRAGEAEPETAAAVGTGTASEGADAGSAEARADAIAAGRSRRFREETREARIGIAHEAERLFGRKVSWGVVSEGRKVMFTTLSVPVMTRLRQAERRVLDTLVEAGVARSRSDALAWCVRLVGEHEDSWLTALRGALRRVEQVRADGPRS
jgi:hypothetical protein